MFELDGPKTIANATEIQRDFAKVVEKVKARDVVIIRNNEPIGVLVAIERYEKLFPARTLPKSLDYFVEEIKKAKEQMRDRIVAVTLFGSVACGTATEDSDIDVLVVVKGLDKRLNDLISVWSTTAMAKTDYRDFLVAMPMDKAHWEKLNRMGTLFAREIRQDGIALWKNS